MSDDYFGYTTGQNRELVENRRLAARMGDDIRYYPPPGNETYIEPTPNFAQRFEGGISPGDESRDYYANGIEQIYKRIMSQDSVVLYQLADQWFELNQVLDDLRTRVLKAATNLKEGGDGAGGNGGWAGAGADAFLARGPGATLKSIDDWEQASYQNWMGTLALVSVINQRRGEMVQLWREYKEAMVSQSQMWLDDPRNYNYSSNKPYSSPDDIPPKSYEAEQYITWMRDAQLAWHHKAQKIQWDMAQDYWSTMSQDYAGGRTTVYEGPTDAVMPNMEFIARYKLGPMPNIPKPNITTPDGVDPNITKPNVAKPEIDVPNVQQIVNDPQITAPSVDNIPTPDITAPTVTPPNITAPVVTPPAIAPPVLPPIAPPALTTGGPGGLPAVRPGALPATNDLLSNLKSGTGPGVLRAGMTPPGGEGLPPGMPQGGRPGQAPPPPAIKGRGPNPNTPMAPPQGKGGAPDKTTPTRPGTPAAPGMTNQFGGPPGTPASPVLRNPHATPGQPGRGGGPRRGTPGLPGVPTQRNPDGTNLRPDAAPPVLGRPAPRTPERMPPARPSAGSTNTPGGLPNPLAPPQRRTASPVVGRSAQAGPGAPRPPEPTAGVMRGKRNDGNSGYEAEIGSRKRDAKDPQVTIDEEFDRINAVLAQEGAWTVDTPGGGVLDAAPPRPQARSAEPKPTLGT
ncbi:hypothetical protein GCM10022251_69830 [Phytohabitans flavus]|uniref:Uncharacterized protein n=1 Tax=Phytohabitans flavus TaxID=1076124 RepID=A0A6F8Y937_9ACTN|nr:hypothetical protein [Phytohabitans flavus]BCB82498.1 hypothetical protein Pflav_089080 [Phytohabitans flavus]